MKIAFLFAFCLLPCAISAASANRIEMRGTLQVTVADDFGKGRSKTLYSLQTEDGKSYSLEFGSQTPRWTSGTPVRIQGDKANGHVRVTTIEQEMPVSTSQTSQVTVGSVSGSAGAVVEVPISITAGSAAVSSLEWEVSLPPGVNFVSAKTGQAAASAGKTVRAHARPRSVRMLVYGMNQNGLGSGPLATLRLKIAATVSSGRLALPIKSLGASGPTTTAVPVGGVPGAISVTGRS